MKGDDWMGVLVIGGIIVAALFGGIKGGSSGSSGGLFDIQNSNPTPSTPQSQAEIEYKIRETQYQVENLKRQVQAEEDKKNNSQYFGLVKLGFVNRTTNPSQEYITMQASFSAGTPILVTGWTVKSLATNVSMTIPKGAYLFFTGMVNAEQDIYLEKGETLYLISGVSPVGASFKSNKCSGYLNQFQTFAPYLNSNCPLPRNENLTSIPRTVNNDACFDYIDRFPMCRIQTESLPINWSYECNNFIYNKINYPSCVETHKNDKDFYGAEWRVYLRRTESIWKTSREEIVLYDNVGKVVDTLKY